MNTKFSSAYLFYDVLSGEFKPPSDSQGRTHTLARLTMAAFQKGDHKQTPQDTAIYRPSWAAGSIATAEALRSGELTGLMIRQDIPAGGSNWASFSKFQARGIGHGPQVHVVDSTGFDVTRPLRLGDELEGLQADIAAVAQGFYDRLYGTVQALPQKVRDELLGAPPVA